MTFAQRLGRLHLIIHCLPYNYTGKLTVTFEFHNGALKEMNQINTAARVELQKLNERFEDENIIDDQALKA